MDHKQFPHLLVRVLRLSNKRGNSDSFFFSYGSSQVIFPFREYSQDHIDPLLCPAERHDEPHLSNVGKVITFVVSVPVLFSVAIARHVIQHFFQLHQHQKSHGLSIGLRIQGP